MRRIATVLTAAALLGLFPFSQAEAAGFKNCTDLRKIYPNGVAQSSTSLNKGAGPIQRPRVNPSIYRLNKKLDIDRDGIACELVNRSPKPSPGPEAPQADPGATPPNQSIESINLAWVFKSELPVIPGTLVDGSPDIIQDHSLNSSFVVLATRAGVAIPNVEVVWTASDPNSRVVPFSAKTDSSGMARIWYFAGKDLTQSIRVAPAQSSSLPLIAEMQRAALVPKTVGRYVSTYLSAPGFTEANPKYDKFEIKVVPKSSPMNTYYQLSTTWQKNHPGHTSFYGGIQQANCKVAAHYYPKEVCQDSRGGMAGRLALFSAWDSPSPSGPKSPRVVSLGPSARCVPFNHEGSGQSCSQPLDWKVGEEVNWRVEVLGQIVSGYFRVRTSVAISSSSNFVEVATLDVPDEPDLRTVAPFVEEWAGDEAESCLDAEVRELEILALSFFNEGKVFRPVYGQALGGLYSDVSTRCMNYSITATKSGVTIKSGGLAHWVDMRPIISRGARNLPFGFGFENNNQVLWPWQDMDITPLR